MKKLMISFLVASLICYSYSATCAGDVSEYLIKKVLPEFSGITGSSQYNLAIYVGPNSGDYYYIDLVSDASASTGYRVIVRRQNGIDGTIDWITSYQRWTGYGTGALASDESKLYYFTTENNPILNKINTADGSNTAVVTTSFPIPPSAPSTVHFELSSDDSTIFAHFYTGSPILCKHVLSGTSMTCRYVGTVSYPFGLYPASNTKVIEGIAKFDSSNKIMIQKYNFDSGVADWAYQIPCPTGLGICSAGYGRSTINDDDTYLYFAGRWGQSILMFGISISNGSLLNNKLKHIGGDSCNGDITKMTYANGNIYFPNA